jgi:hypothetical protein
MKKKWYHIFKVITDSAGLAFILSIAFFAYETWESKRETKEVVDNLVQIQNSLSTRYLGLFPEYISNINVQLEHAMERQNYSPNPQDSIIIFQDVLYYGILSDPEGFRNMNRNLLTLANNGCHVTIAYYGLNSEPFNRMLKDALIDTRYHTAYQQSIKDHRNEVRRLNSELAALHFAPNTPEYKAALLEKVKMYFPDAYHRLADIQSGDNQVRRIMHTLNDRAYIDSLASERYFDSTKVILKEKLLKKRKGYLRGIPLDKHATDSITLRVNQMCKQLDDVKKKYLDKNFKNLRFADYQNMYVEMSQTIIDLYSLSSNIEIIPLSETLLMSCWLTKVGGQEHAIFAFPSKYSTDEIGFISQDKAISDYIHKMLSGIQNGMLHSDRHH